MGPLPRVIPYFEGSFGKGKMIFESPHNSKTCPHNHIIILTSRIFSICCFINYTNVKCNRMEGRRPAIQLWLRLLVLWSQLVAFKCAPEGHLEAICPKYTPCTGAQNQGVFLVHLYHHLIWFFFYFYILCLVQFWFTTFDACFYTLFHTSLDFEYSPKIQIKIRRNKSDVATQHWCKLHHSWNPLEEFKCVTGGP